MRIKIKLWAIILFMLVSCHSPNEQLTKLWMYTHYSGTSDSKTMQFSPTSFLLLRHDGSFTRDFGTFESGDWQLQKDNLLLFINHRLSSSYQLSTDGHDMRLTIPDKGLLNFESAPLNENIQTENPFDAKNNLWRIRAAHKETEKEILSRLLNHLEYWQAYFTWAYTNNMNSVDVRSMPTPIKIYGNGFALKPLTELPRSWINLFYDEQDCVSANKLLEAEFKTNDIAWPHTENKYKMFIGAFQQLHDRLR